MFAQLFAVVKYKGKNIGVHWTPLPPPPRLNKQRLVKSPVNKRLIVPCVVCPLAKNSI